MEATHGPWTIRYGGGRLADIYHAEYESAIDAVQVAQYDWVAGEVEEEINAEHLQDALARWANDYGPQVSRHQLPYSH